MRVLPADAMLGTAMSMCQAMGLQRHNGDAEAWDAEMLAELRRDRTAPPL